MPSLPSYMRSAPVGQERMSREELDELQRERVAGAAIAVFARKGYPETTVDDLVSGAKIGVGSFYAFFGGKEECFVAAYEQILAGVRERIGDALSADDSWAAQSCAALDALLRWVEAEPAEARVAFVEAQTAGAAALERHQRQIDAATKWLGLGRREHSGGTGPPNHAEEVFAGGLAWYLRRQLELGEFQGAGVELPNALQIAVVPFVEKVEADGLLARAMASAGQGANG